jgi:CRP/FNR family transcriptional regulator, cyclic AMP receptor protein
VPINQRFSFRPKAPPGAKRRGAPRLSPVPTQRESHERNFGGRGHRPPVGGQNAIPRGPCGRGWLAPRWQPDYIEKHPRQVVYPQCYPKPEGTKLGRSKSPQILVWRGGRVAEGGGAPYADQRRRRSCARSRCSTPRGCCLGMADIQQGKVKLTVVSEQGKEAVVAILGPGHFFGEGCLNGHPLRIATTRAVDECVITRLEKATMIATIHNEPEFSELFMSYLLSRNSRIEEDLIDQLFNSSEKRLARLLLLLANFGKEGRPEPIVGTFSQETLAEMIGTTRSRVSFFMNKFRKLGFIEYNGKLEVHNSLLNVVLYDKPEIKTRDASAST